MIETANRKLARGPARRAGPERGCSDGEDDANQPPLQSFGSRRGLQLLRLGAREVTSDAPDAAARKPVGSAAPPARGSASIAAWTLPEQTTRPAGLLALNPTASQLSSPSQARPRACPTAGARPDAPDRHIAESAQDMAGQPTSSRESRCSGSWQDAGTSNVPVLIRFARQSHPRPRRMPALPRPRGRGCTGRPLILSPIGQSNGPPVEVGFPQGRERSAVT